MSTNLVRTLAIGGILAGSSGCAVVGDIFKAGMWVGIIAVVAVLAVAGALVHAVSTRK